MAAISNKLVNGSDRGGRIIDLGVTLICWCWFTMGFVFFYSWCYLAVALWQKEREKSFQKLNSSFYRVFFRIVTFCAPSQTIHIDKEVQDIRSAVIVCNHLSYLDPLLLIATFPRQKTIVKARFFDMPIFGRIIAMSGYLPDSPKGRFSGMMLDQIESMQDYLQDGGNLFIFPEGTRSRDGSLGVLSPGALKIARLCRAPIYLLQISNTEKLFAPGTFLFNTRKQNSVSLRILERMDPDYDNDSPTTSQLQARMLGIYERAQS